MKKLISLSSILAILISQAGCVGDNSDKQNDDISFPYATQEIKEQLAEKLLYKEKPIPTDYFETIDYTPIMQQLEKKGPSILGEKEEQQTFWYYLMRLRLLIMYYTYPRASDDWGILVEILNSLGEPSREFIENHPKEGQEIFASVIAYEEKFPYNPQKGIDEERKNILSMTRLEASKKYNVPVEELNKLSDEEFKKDLQDVLGSMDNVPEVFPEVREKIIQAFKNDLAQMKSGLSPEEYAKKQKADLGIAEYSIYLQAPKLFPAELFFAEFVLDPQNDDKRYSFRKLFLSNNNGVGGTRIENEKPLPHKVDMIWYSIVENKLYSLETDLPYEKIKEKVMHSEDEYNNGLLFTLAPYGKVDMYIYNTIKGTKELLGSFQAKETQVDLNDFRRSGTLYENSENLAKDWADYQQKALVGFPEAATLLAQRGIPSPNFDFWNDKIDLGEDTPLPEKEKLNTLDETGQTPLIKAVRTTNDLLVTKLLAAGVDVNVDSPDFGTALMNACSLGNIGVVKQLIKAGADINKANVQSGRTPLIEAVQTGNLEIVKLLVEAGADINATEVINGQNTNFNALKYAKDGNHSQIAQYLLEKGAKEMQTPVSEVSASVSNSLDQAVMMGDIAKVNELLAKGANPNTQISGVGSVLWFACSMGNVEMVQTLLSAKADVNVAASSGLTPLMVAVQLNNKQIVELLLKAGADVNAVCSGSGLTALQTAQNMGFAEIVALLKSAGAKA